MTIENVAIGIEVVRSKGDYVVGNTGNVVMVNIEEKRVQVSWNGSTTTWVKVDCVEPTSIPYEIIKSTVRNRKTGLPPNPKYSVK